MSVLKFLVSDREIVGRKGPFQEVETRKAHVYVNNKCYELCPGAGGVLEVRAAQDTETGDIPTILMRPRSEGVGIDQE